MNINDLRKQERMNCLEADDNRGARRVEKKLKRRPKDFIKR